MEHPTWEDLINYLDKQLAPDRHNDVETHVASCDDCTGQLDWLYKTTGLLRADTFVPPPRRVRVAAESLFDLRMSNTAASPSGQNLVSETSVSPAAASTSAPDGKVVPFPHSSEHKEGTRVIRPPVSIWRRMAWIGGAVAALLVIAFFAAQPPQGPLVAAVQEQQGSVDITSPNSGFSLPFTGSTLSEGSAIATGADGSAQLVFANGAVRVVMLGDSNIVYVGGAESDGAISRVALATDKAGDLEIDAGSGVTVDLQSGVGLFTTTGGRYRFHYLEPKIVGVQVLRGTVTVRSEIGVYELHEGEEEILDYSQPLSTPTVESAIASTPAVSVPTATVAAPTSTRLPTRLPPSETATVAVPIGEHEDSDSETESESEDHEDSRTTIPEGSGSGDSGGTIIVSPLPVMPESAASSSAVPTEFPSEEGESSGTGSDHESDHNDPSDGGSDDNGSGGDDSEHESEHDPEHESDHD